MNKKDFITAMSMMGALPEDKNPQNIRVKFYTSIGRIEGDVIITKDDAKTFSGQVLSTVAFNLAKNIDDSSEFIVLENTKIESNGVNINAGNFMLFYDQVVGISLFSKSPAT